MKRISRNMRYTTSVSVMAMAVACFASGAWAQDTIETVVVTATGTNISGIAAVGSESITLDREKMLSTGLTNITDVVRTLPQVTNLGTLREGSTSAYGGNTTQGTAINMRGLGAAATLTLVDGHRLAPSGTASTFTEATQVPMAALAKVEMIVDGNSAIYGSDAIGGVVNFVLRKDFEGVQASARYTAVDGYSEYGASVTAGHLWDHLGGRFGAGNAIISYDYTWRDNMESSSRARLSQNLTQYGGVDNRISSGALNGGVGAQNSSTATPGVPGNIVVCTYYAYGSCQSGTYLYYGLPSGANDSLTAAQLKTTPNLADSANYNDYLGSMWRHQVAAFFNQEISPWVSVYAEGFFTKRQTTSRGLQTSTSVCLPATSPYYVAGISNENCSTGPSSTDASVPGQVVQYNFSKDVGNWMTTNPDETYTVIFGIKAKLPSDWNADFSFTNGVDHACGVCQIGNNVDTGAFQHLVSSGEINPLSSEPLSKTVTAKILGSNIQKSHNIIDDLVMKFDGPLFDLPGGTVKAAFGFEYTYSSQGLANGANRTEGEQAATAPVPTHDNEFIWDNVTTLGRSVSSAFLEMYVPVVGEANAVPFVQSLSFDGAVRFDHYSDFGDTMNPKIGATWKINDDFSTRGSWGTSFRAPALTDINPNVFSYKGIFPWGNYTSDTSINSFCYGTCYAYALYLLGDTPGLKPEKSENWSLGIDFTPRWFEGFKFSTSYYNIHYSDQIVWPNTGEYLSSDANKAAYANYVTPITNGHTGSGCIEGNRNTYDPKILPYVDATGVYGNLTGNICKVTVVIDGRVTNLGTTNQTGLDFNTSYSFESKIGVFNLDAQMSVVLTDKTMVTAGTPVTDRLDTYGYPVSLRGRGGINWMNGPWAANLFINYVGSYKNTQPLNSTVKTDVSDYTTFDAGLTYTFGDEVWTGFNGVRLSANVQNLLDKDPPLILTSSYTSYDPQNADIRGRIITIQLTKDF